jgi:hypothetical protein
MHQAASNRAYLILSALLSLPAFGCDAGEDPADENTGGTSAMGGSGGGGAGPTDGVLVSDCEKASVNDPTVYDGYSKREDLGWEIAWFTYTDAIDAMMMGTAVGTITPVEKGSFACIEDTVNGVMTHVFNAKGMGFTAWGAGMGFNFKLMADPTPPGNVDISMYKGVRFWAKANSTTTGSVRLKLVDQQVTPIARGGTCTGNEGRCDNTFGYPLAVSTDWQPFTVPFDQMMQESWASQKFMTPQLTNVIGFQFQVGANRAFDYSVDDFTLYK